MRERERERNRKRMRHVLPTGSFPIISRLNPGFELCPWTPVLESSASRDVDQQAAEVEVEEWDTIMSVSYPLNL